LHEDFSAAFQLEILYEQHLEAAVSLSNPALKIAARTPIADVTDCATGKRSAKGRGDLASTVLDAIAPCNRI
jgi:hypothetical protein